MEELAYISLTPSRMARYVQGIAVALALSALWISGLAWWLDIFLSLLLVAILLRQWRRDREVWVQGLDCAGGRWRLWTSRGEQTVELRREQLVLSWLVVLQWCDPVSGKSAALALWPDSASPDDLRRLRVFLRFGPVS